MTQSAIDFLESEVERKRTAAKAVIDAAEQAARPLTDDEKQKIQQIRDEVDGKGGLKERIAEFRENEEMRKLVEGMDAATTQKKAEQAPEAKSLGDAFVKSDSYRAFKTRGGAVGMSGNWKTESVEIPYDLFEGKATVTQTASPIVQPDTQSGMLPILFKRLTVADLLASGTTDSNTVRYIEETTATNAADAVAEGANKPESTLIFAQRDEPVRKIATFLPVSDEMLEDVAQLRSYLDSRLRLFIQQEEEDQILNGTGVAPNLNGLMNRTGVQTQAIGTDNAHDAIFKAIGKVRNVFMEPDGIIVHPNDWEGIRLAKDANQQYYGGGPFTGAYGVNGIAPDSLWSKAVVVTPAITEGTALVGAFRTAAQVFRRGGLTVEASNSHSDFFQKNLTAIRAEERLALAVYRPTAFCKVTGI